MKTRLKEKLLEECNLHTIVRLPNGVFNPYTSIKTNLLFFTKGTPTQHIWLYEHPYPEGVKNYNKLGRCALKNFRPKSTGGAMRPTALPAASKPNNPGKSASTTSRPATITSTSKSACRRTSQP